MLRQHQLPPHQAVEEVCHEEQMTIWTGEIAGALNMAGFIRDDMTYDDVIALHSVLADEIKSIVEAAYEHPEVRIFSVK